MANQDTKHLCGGIFFVLLLESRGYHRNARMGAGRKGDGKSEPDVFAKLISTVIPDFKKPSSGRTFNTFTSDYKLCRKSDSPTAPLTDPRVVKKYDAEVINNYSDKLSEFSVFLENSIDLETNGRWLVAALLDLIESDERIPDNAEFFILPNGKPVKKDMLANEKEYCTSAFLMGVWHYILTHIMDNTIGNATLSFLMPQTTANAERHFDRTFGAIRAEQITVHNVNDTQAESHSSAYTDFKSTIPEDSKPTKMRVSYRGSTLTSDMEQTFLSWNPTVIDLNLEPNAYLLNSNRNAKFVIKNTCRLNFEMAPDCTLQIKVCFTIDDTEFSGFTSSDNWNSQSYVNNLVSVGEYDCLVWFKVLNPTATNPQVQFFMIGEPDE